MPTCSRSRDDCNAPPCRRSAPPRCRCRPPNLRPRPGADLVDVMVCGAHMSGLPLNKQLHERGAWQISTTRTAPIYRFYALPGGPPFRPGLVQVSEGGVAIDVEVWRMPVEHFGSFVSGIPGAARHRQGETRGRQQCFRLPVRIARRRQRHRHQRARRMAAVPAHAEIGRAISAVASRSRRCSWISRPRAFVSASVARTHWSHVCSARIQAVARRCRLPAG